jgi:16S rRNA G1207 methylase RsmC
MDVYFKKEITYAFEGYKFKFDVGNTLFSTFDLDHGTDALIRAISPENNPKTILDIGCGYGPLGIILAKKYPQAQVIMVDKDLLAVRYAKLNIEKNMISNASVLGSVGMEQVKSEKFDLIVSNIPAKIGDQAISQEFILDPFAQLNPGGELWVVVVNALNHLIPKVGSQNQLNMKLIKKRSGHSVYRVKKKI